MVVAHECGAHCISSARCRVRGAVLRVWASGARLRYLATNPNRVLTKAQILDHVWEYDFNGEMGIVESYVSYLRKKLDPLSQEPLIITKRGVGYMLKGPKG